jgi:hypothetical protein
MKLFSIILGICVALPLGFSTSGLRGAASKIRFTNTPRNVVSTPRTVTNANPNLDAGVPRSVSDGVSTGARRTAATISGNSLYPGKTADEVRFLKSFKLTDEEINAVTPAQLQNYMENNLVLLNRHDSSLPQGIPLQLSSGISARAGGTGRAAGSVPAGPVQPGISQQSPEDIQFLKSLGIREEDLASVSPAKLTELRNGLSEGEQNFLRDMGLDADAITRVTREQLGELRGDKVKLTVKEKTALREMGFSSDDVSKITREELGDIVQAISANAKSNFWWQ